MLKTFTRTQIKIALLALIHLVGFYGIKSNFHEFFLLLTPLNLVLSSLILLYGKFSKIPLLSYFYIMCFTLCIEILSVKTGFPFGHYNYDSSLGIKLFGVPLIIGFNWALLLYVCTAISNQLVEENLVLKNGLYKSAIKAFMAASMMLTIDLFIEPKASLLNFWHWENNAIPLSNYISWFAISFILSLFFKNYEKQTALVNFSYLLIICVFFGFM
ncbi:MAG: carotenoid biosynthesis protein [Candidatus Caenarcaniphilales bacterium]|nr:carotenoid biosynthesis protein [Candidatus Caenarcaniphilales bacterium]